MPFTKITKGKNKGKYRTESGKIYTKEQVEAYYASKRAGHEMKSKKGG